MAGHQFESADSSSGQPAPLGLRAADVYSKHNGPYFVAQAAGAGQNEVQKGNLPNVSIDGDPKLAGKAQIPASGCFGADILPTADLEMIQALKKAQGAGAEIKYEMYKALSDGNSRLTSADRENSILYKLEKGLVDPNAFKNAVELLSYHGDKKNLDAKNTDIKPTPSPGGTNHQWERLKVNPDGTGDVEVKNGDCIWNIAKEVLKHNHPEGYKPSNRAILEAVGKIQKANPKIKDGVWIFEHDHVKIPKELIKTQEKNETRPEPDKKNRIPIENRGASKEFQEKVQKDLDNLPEGVRKLLIANGTKIVIGGTVSDAKPELKNVRPRGWPPGSTWDNADGLYSPGDKTVVIAEYRMDGDKKVPSGRTAGVERHEIGHAVDHAMGDLSHSEEFDKAYQQDIAKLSAADRQRLTYLLQNDNAGKEETFAEIFAGINGQTCNAGDTAYILSKFPNVAELLRRKQAAL